MGCLSNNMNHIAPLFPLCKWGVDVGLGLISLPFQVLFEVSKQAPGKVENLYTAVQPSAGFCRGHDPAVSCLPFRKKPSWVGVNWTNVGNVYVPVRKQLWPHRAASNLSSLSSFFSLVSGAVRPAAEITDLKEHHRMPCKNTNHRLLKRRKWTFRRRRIFHHRLFSKASNVPADLTRVEQSVSVESAEVTYNCC